MTHWDDAITYMEHVTGSRPLRFLGVSGCTGSTGYSGTSGTPSTKKSKNYKEIFGTRTSKSNYYKAKL